MIEGLKPYAEYKESGLPWLGKVPAHWDVRRTKLILREVDSRSTTGKEQLLRVSHYTGVTQRKAADGSDAPNTRAASLVGYKRVSVNDLVINIMLAWNGSMGVSRFDGIASPAYCVYRLNKGAQPWYFHQLFRLPLYKGRIKAVSTGVIESRLRLYSDDLGRIEAILPPLDEQAAIVRFLDHANRKIDGFIRVKRRLIGLLNEQKQAIIHHAVTRGLNPEATLKPSGIPWLGDIPQHWGTPRLAQLSTRIGDGLHGTPEYVDQSPYHFINGNNLVNGCIRLKASTRCVGLAEFKKHAVPLDESTLLMSINGTIGSIALYQGESVILGKSAAYINCNKSLTREYLLCFLQSPAVVNFLRQEVTGTTIFNLSLASIRSLPIALPSIDEQLSIVGSIEKNTAPTSTAIARTEREIALMQEYRTRLTADIVTGKLDVREAAAKLPDLPTDSAAEPLTDEAPDDTESEEIET